MSEHISERASTPEGQAEIRAEANSLLVSENMSLQDAARASSIPAGTLGPWLKGQYAGRNDRVATNVERWMKSRHTQEAARMVLPKDPGFVMTPSAEEYFSALTHAKIMPDMTLIAGSPGVGKTYALEEYRKRTPNVFMLTASPAMTTPRLVLDELRDTLGIDERYSAQKVEKAVMKALHGTGGLILIDEANHLTSQALDQIRSIHDQTKVGVAFAGNEKVYSRLEGGSRSVDYAQIYSRLGMRIRKVRPTPGDIDAVLNAWKVEDQQSRRVLHVIGKRPGALRNVVKTLKLAHIRASGDGLTEISAPMLDWAWSRLSESSVRDAA
ncbi:AAA family ATPase [Pseudoroseomonas cervicalis]|uniref:Mu B transposition domain protein n=1 Tax=Pseudoroseomonas cervicalis ATCC 49957 TaxID=525371 RepID=D5RM54_9PROT|nr:AAA family ATPase [Pseudoroseomonas cervicalis]EFH11606.1 Mu B transposition domain protein [Pseudoroseomonas cervicalis ATCC 49957]